MADLITVENVNTGEWFRADEHCDYGLGEIWVPCTTTLFHDETAEDYIKEHFDMSKMIQKPDCKKEGCFRRTNKVRKCRSLAN